MKTVSGVIHATKKERELMIIAMAHAQHDLQYGYEGTYTPMSESKADRNRAHIEITKGEEGLKLIRWIITTL